MIPKCRALFVVCAVCWLAPGDAGAITWLWSNPLPHGNDVFDMTWHNGLTVEVSDSGQLYTSDDLNLWLSRNTLTTNDLLGVTYLGNRLVAVGALGSVVFSDDGVNFTCTNLPTANGDWLVSVAASSNLLVAVGDEAIIWTSLDGAKWTYQGKAPNNPNGYYLRGVTYGSGLFVVVGEGGYIATSANGTNWTKQAPPIGFTDDINWVSYINTPASTNGFNTPVFIAVSDPGNAISSPNGTSWARLANAPGTNSLYGVTGDSDSRLLVGDNMLYLEDSPTPTFTNQVMLSPFQTNLAPTWTYYSSVSESNGYVVAGESGFAAQGVPATNAPYDWSALDSSSRSWMWQVTTAANFYVSVGSDATIMTSGDGANWSIEEVPYTNGVARTNTVFFGVGGSSNLLIAVGNAGTIVLSTNNVVTITNNGIIYTNSSTLGVIWDPMPAPTTNDLHGVAYFGGQYFVSGGNGTILASANGQAWTAQTTPTTHYLSCLEVCSNGMVAVGDAGTILTSPDGTTWTARASPTTNWIFRVRNLGGRLIAVGENGTVLTSANSGTNWTARASGTTSWLNDVCLVTNSYYVVGNQGAVLTSTNSTNWSIVPSITYNSLYGAATQNGQLIAVGIDGSIVRSQIIPFTSPVNILSYSQADGQNLFLVGGTTNQFGIAIDQFFTLDSSTNLVNWTTGPQLQTDSSGSLLFFTSVGTNPPPYSYYRAALVIPP